MRLIDADATCDVFAKIMNLPKDYIGPSDIMISIDAVFSVLGQVPDVDPVKHGYWIHGSSSENIKVTCSECGYKVNYFWDSWQDAKYCPNCGAKMDE